MTTPAEVQCVSPPKELLWRYERGGARPTTSSWFSNSCGFFAWEQLVRNDPITSPISSWSSVLILVSDTSNGIIMKQGEMGSYGWSFRSCWIHTCCSRITRTSVTLRLMSKEMTNVIIKTNVRTDNINGGGRRNYGDSSTELGNIILKYKQGDNCRSGEMSGKIWTSSWLPGFDDYIFCSGTTASTVMVKTFALGSNIALPNQKRLMNGNLKHLKRASSNPVHLFFHPGLAFILCSLATWAPSSSLIRYKLSSLILLLHLLQP